jgi:hypothetical protein
MMGAGEQCVMTAGTCEIQLWSAGSWAVGDLGSQTLWQAALAGGQAPSGWMTWAVWGQRLRWSTALPLHGGSTTVLTMRMSGSPALVRTP